jgi:hypothetical protein
LFYIGFNLSPILTPTNNYLSLWCTYLLTPYFIALNGLKIARSFWWWWWKVHAYSLRIASLRIASLRIWWKVHAYLLRNGGKFTPILAV